MEVRLSAYKCSNPKEMSNDWKNEALKAHIPPDWISKHKVWEEKLNLCEYHRIFELGTMIDQITYIYTNLYCENQGLHSDKSKLA